MLIGYSWKQQSHTYTQTHTHTKQWQTLSVHTFFVHRLSTQPHLLVKTDMYDIKKQKTHKQTAEYTFPLSNPLEYNPSMNGAHEYSLLQ